MLKPVTHRHRDRIVLIGDAAHPVGAGQGASIALEDAIILAPCCGHARCDTPRSPPSTANGSRGPARNYLAGIGEFALASDEIPQTN